ncbi:purine permease 3-like [Lolium rigidum]|uniref:purine permease 3-like n=1 Tax=Lolium rigidum TaxID=89674 RepID=UPI001F5D2920|nr:purine permease 3-like [Lolium rigidum]
MEVETSTAAQQQAASPEQQPPPLHRNMLAIVNVFLMAIGAVAGPLILRAYFVHGGNRKWLSSFLQTAGWPLLLPPLISRRRKDGSSSPLFLMPPRLLAVAAGLGVAIGLIDLLYAYGLAYLPVSTSSILISTQLAFTALFALVVVRQRFTAFSVNAVVLLTIGAAMLGMNGGSSDRPEGVSRAQYYAGFAMTIGSSAMYGLVLPLMELSQARLAGRLVGSYSLIVEMQVVMGFTATAFCAVGMIVNKDFQAIPHEARVFGLGQGSYYSLLVGSAIVYQFFFIGIIGAIFYGSALLSSVIMTLLISITEVIAIIVFHEPFNSTKGVALALSLWGFVSYFYGEIQTNAKQSDIPPNIEHLSV